MHYVCCKLTSVGAKITAWPFDLYYEASLSNGNGNGNVRGQCGVSESVRMGVCPSMQRPRSLIGVDT